jgi:predicted Zn-dependent protease
MGVEEQVSKLREEVGITDDVLIECARATYNMLDAGRPAEAAVMAKGLVAADRRNPYYRSLLGTALMRGGKRAEALEVVDQGLQYAPGDKDLVALRSALVPPSSP